MLLKTSFNEATIHNPLHIHFVDMKRCLALREMKISLCVCIHYRVRFLFLADNIARFGKTGKDQFHTYCQQHLKI